MISMLPRPDILSGTAASMSPAPDENSGRCLMHYEGLYRHQAQLYCVAKRIIVARTFFQRASCAGTFQLLIMLDTLIINY